MKKRHGLARALPKLARDEIAKLPTGALLARLTRLQWCEESAEHSDRTESEIASVADLILFKSDAQWQAAYSDLKEELASREHMRRRG